MVCIEYFLDKSVGLVVVVHGVGVVAGARVHVIEGVLLIVFFRDSDNSNSRRKQTLIFFEIFQRKLDSPVCDVGKG